MKYELEIISDINSPTSNKILVKQDKIKKIFDLDNIELEEFIDAKSGKHIKKYCSIVINNNLYKINKPYEELKFMIINSRIPVIGLVNYSKKYK